MVDRRRAKVAPKVPRWYAFWHAWLSSHGISYAIARSIPEPLNLFILNRRFGLGPYDHAAVRCTWGSPVVTHHQNHANGVDPSSCIDERVEAEKGEVVGADSLR